MRRPWWVALAIAALLIAPGPALGDVVPRAKVVVCVARDSPAARVAAADVSRALASVAPVRVAATGAACALDQPGERVILVVDADDDRVVLSARGRAGKAWSPRTVERSDGGPTLFREQVAVAARSLASAALDAETASVAASPESAEPTLSVAPVPVSPPLAAPAPPPSVAPSSPPPSARPPLPQQPAPLPHAEEPALRRVGGPPLFRIEAGYAATTIGSALPIESGVSVAAFWLAPRLRLGAVYTFFPGASVASSDTTLVVTRHAAAAYAGFGYRVGAFELGGAAGPLLDVWLRSTTKTTGKATAPASFADGGLSLRADVGYALTATLGLHAALSAEIAPWSPEFRGPTGLILDPAVARARLDVGFTVAVP